MCTTNKCMEQGIGYKWLYFGQKKDRLLQRMLCQLTIIVERNKTNDIKSTNRSCSCGCNKQREKNMKTLFTEFSVKNANSH